MKFFNNFHSMKFSYLYFVYFTALASFQCVNSFIHAPK